MYPLFNYGNTHGSPTSAETFSGFQLRWRISHFGPCCRTPLIRALQGGGGFPRNYYRKGSLRRYVHGFWKFLGVFGGFSRFFKVFHGFSGLFKVFGGFRRCLKVFGGVWRFLKVFGGFLGFLKVFGGF